MTCPTSLEKRSLTVHIPRLDLDKPEFDKVDHNIQTTMNSRSMKYCLLGLLKGLSIVLPNLLKFLKKLLVLAIVAIPSP